MPINLLARLVRKLSNGAPRAAATPSPSAGAATAAEQNAADEAARHVMVYATIGRESSGKLRHELVRACGADADLIRFAPIAGTDEVRVSLRLHASAVTAATAAIARHGGPSMEIMEVPETQSTTSWLDGLLARPIATHATADEHEHFPAPNPIAAILSPTDILLDVAAESTGELFALIGAFLEERHGLPAALVTAQLSAREHSGATAIGRGLAIPHARLKDLRRALALYIRPRTPIPFDAPDGKPVTDILVLLVPERANRQHLDLLATAAQLFCDGDFRERLKESLDAHAVYLAFFSRLAGAAPGGQDSTES